MSGLVCLAVPIYQKKAKSRSCVAALAIQAPVTRLPLADIQTKLPILQKAAETLGRNIDRVAGNNHHAPE